jgi:hypothetical protein
MEADPRHARAAATPTLRSRVLVFFIVGAIVFPLVLGLGMTRGINHDEHQHVAAGALVAREGLLPYRDFPHFHTPYLAYAYALLFRATEHLLFAARLLSVLCATAILGCIGSAAYHLFRERGRKYATWVCGGSVLLALSTTLFAETSGRAWNHEPSLVLVLGAFAAHIAGLRLGWRGWFVASGLLLGLAIGTRITCAPLVAPFGLALLLFPKVQWQWGRVLGFSAGLLLGLAVLGYFFAAVPEQAYFCNFDFARVNIVYRLDTGEPRTMTLLKKLRFFFKVIVRPDAGLFVAGLLPILAAYLAARKTDRRLRFELHFILLLLPFIFLGSFAPSPIFDQYFYPLVPFLVLAGLYAFASISPESPWFRRTALTGMAAVALSVALGVRVFHEAGDFFQPRKWEGIRMHREMREAGARVAGGRVLTLAPIYPLEAGLPIYPAFSTGPFAWRISPYLDPAKAARLGIISPTTLEAALRLTPPGAVLVGSEEKGEETLAAYAKRQGFQKFDLEDDLVFWIAPGR